MEFVLCTCSHATNRDSHNRLMQKLSDRLAESTGASLRSAVLILNKGERGSRCLFSDGLVFSRS